MKNKPQDLNDHLFVQMERLNDENLKGDELQQEIQRSKAMGDIAHKIISNAQTAIEAQKLRLEFGPNARLPKMLD